MLKISLWVDRPPGPDPTFHRWFCEPDGLYFRLCDGAQWMEVPEVDNLPEIRTPCMPCLRVCGPDMSRNEVFHFQQGPLPITRESSKKDYPRAFWQDYTWYNEGILACEVGVMPIVGMMILAQFCCESDKQQLSRIQQRLAPRSDGGGNPYVQLLNIFRDLHWRSGDIEYLREGYPLRLNEVSSKQNRRQRFQELTEAYIASWDAMRFVLVTPPPPGQLVIEGLTVTVDPEIGARTVQGGKRLLKLWLNKKPPASQLVCDILAYLMRCLGEQEGWDGSWQLGVWDLDRRRVVSPAALDRFVEETVAKGAKRFVELMNRP